MVLKNWEILKPQKERAAELVSKYDLHPVVADIVAARGMSNESLEEYFGDVALEDPFVLKDMQKAVDRINLALEQEELVAIYGDYDCDGVTATTILYNYLSCIGMDVMAHIPEREGGYGMKEEEIRALKAQGIQLIITVDSGITAVEEAKLIQQLDMDLIITDHHEIADERPKAVAIVNPRQADCPSAFKHLAGVGVAFKLIAAMQDGDYESAFELAGDLTAIGTVGDVMPLVGENRTIVRRGISLLQCTENLGLRALLSVTKIDIQRINAGNIGFQIAPRINAAGRIGSARDAFLLLQSEDEAQAEELANKLDYLVKERQGIEEQILEEIYQEIEQKPARLYDRIMVFAGNWPAGVIGVVSGKLTSFFGRPSVVFTVDGETAYGSARSIAGFPIYRAIQANEQWCLQWGGHELAAGMTVKTQDIDSFRKGLNGYAAKNYSVMPRALQKVDHVLSPEEYQLDTAKAVEIFGPFGSQNHPPLFLIQHAVLQRIQPVGGGKHMKLFFKIGQKELSTVLFGIQLQRLSYPLGTTFTLLGHLGVNHYMDRDSAEFRVVQMLPEGCKMEKLIWQEEQFLALMRGEPVDPETKRNIMPKRDDFVFTYQTLKKSNGFFGDRADLYLLLRKSGIGYCKLSIILEALRQSGLLEVKLGGRQYRVLSSDKKIDLTQCELLHTLGAK